MPCAVCGVLTEGVFSSSDETGIVFESLDAMCVNESRLTHKWYHNIKYMIDVANKWEEGELKSALVKVIANHMKKSYLSWNKDTVKDDVIFEHLLELSDGKINMTQSTEELLNTTDLMRTNKRISNKIIPAGGIKPKITKNGKPNNPIHKNQNRKPL